MAPSSARTWRCRRPRPTRRRLGVLVQLDVDAMKLFLHRPRGAFFCIMVGKSLISVPGGVRLTSASAATGDCGPERHVVDLSHRGCARRLRQELHGPATPTGAGAPQHRLGHAGQDKGSLRSCGEVGKPAKGNAAEGSRTRWPMDRCARSASN